MNFLEQGKMIGCRAIITNPPYALAQEFIGHALEMMEPDGIVSMLLRTDFDHAKTRAHLFSGCPAFAKKPVLTRYSDSLRTAGKQHDAQENDGRARS
jgi:hypothetical protein